MREEERANSTETIVSRVLQAGVVISSVIIVSGLILFFLNHLGQPQASYRQFTSYNYSFPHSVPDIITSLKTSSGAGLIGLGVLLLILTPILRVATSILLFMRQRDIPMALVTLFVLAMLIGSFFIGLIFR